MGIKYIGKCLLISENGEKIVVIGDLHLGYEEALNKSGVYVTREMYNEMLGELDEIFNGIKNNGKLSKVNKVDVKDNNGKVVDKIILLGDVKHTFSGNLRQERNDVLRFIEYLKEKCDELVILRGNHDNYLINIARKGEIEVVNYFIWNEYCFIHGDKEYEEINDKKIKYWIMGHAHPAITLEEGNKRERYKCFIVGKYDGKTLIIVPSFFSLVVGSDVREGLNLFFDFNVDKFDVKIVNGLDVLDFGKVEKIK